MVALRRGVEHRLARQRANARFGQLGKRRRERRRQRCVIGLGAAAGERAVGGGGVVAESLREGADQVTLDLDRQRRVAPRRQLGIERGHQRVGGHAHRGRRGVEQAVIAGMRRVNLVAPQVLAHPVQHRHRVARRGEVELGEQAAQLGRIERRGHAVRFDPLRVVLEDFGDPPPQRAANRCLQQQHQRRNTARSGSSSTFDGPDGRVRVSETGTAPAMIQCVRPGPRGICTSTGTTSDVRSSMPACRTVTVSSTRGARPRTELVMVTDGMPTLSTQCSKK
jgi:hypothetical protein